MIQFKKLRLTGFKSFVEHSELLINTGLTGVVGPNGCGKSNLVEALRWVMGETSAKQMRGGEMDDVIFAGSSARPPRNVAEVALLLDNASRTAPALFNEDVELFVTRRIERAKGSNYKVNGRDVRARDVQLLFADAATGARSTAMVSQGRIGAIINAKPQARRMVLEEAAGISGLHTRRHEAELRLKGAETNLERLDDVLLTLDTQQANLQKQARQASRYHSISERIRKAESLLFHMKWGNALDELDKNRKAFKETDQHVMGLTAKVSEATRIQQIAADKIPLLRDAEARAAATLQRLTIENENLEREEKRLADLKQDLIARRDQTDKDLIREREFNKDAEAALARLTSEQNEITQSGAHDQENLNLAQEKLDTAKTDVLTKEKIISTLTQEIAHYEAQKNSLKNRLNDLERQVQKCADRLQELEQQKKQLNASRIEERDLTAARDNFSMAGEKITALENQLNALETKRQHTQEKLQGALEKTREVQTVLTKLEAEEDALVELLDPKEENEQGEPVLDRLKVDAGYEVALGAALGDDLTFSEDPTASVFWQNLKPLDPMASLPQEALSLDQFVSGSETLARRLSQVGLVDDLETAQKLRDHLLPGQRLVTREGAMIRWDGLTFKTQAPSKAALRLKQKNRLAEIRKSWEEARVRADGFEHALEQVQKQDATLLEDEKHTRQNLKNAQKELGAHQRFLSDLEQQQARFVQKMENLSDLVARATSEQTDCVQASQSAQKQWADFEQSNERQSRLDVEKQALEELRETFLEAQSAFNAIAQEKENRQKRLQDIERESQNWTSRIERTATQISDLEKRQQELETRLNDATQSPEQFNEKRQSLFNAIEEAEKNRTETADLLAEGENALKEVERQTREAETDLARVREERIRLESLMDQGKQLCVSLTERIRERLDCKPEDLPGLAEITKGAELPDLDTGEKRLERLYRERDTMGPVNLRAETELEELKEQIDTLSSERVDLVKAIDKLRQGIGALNREGRERLLLSFNEVNQHFQNLFTRLFGGGQAHLELVEDDDPLNAGLEILASPPGKKLQSLSLLSGGEQALTALALLFGVFLTNPAPICVLDEVDAPLDDANVDRFCTMLEEMAREGETRFLIITHHRMTMARMDRLFGVTMTERGVSQLVSVDLQKAEELVET